MKPEAAGGWRAPIVTLVLLLSSGAALCTAASTESDRSLSYVGRPLIAALEDLRARGLNLIFSSDLITHDMIVATEPSIAAPRQILRQLLSPFGLAAEDGPAGTILIVRATGPEAVSTEDPVPPP